MCVLFFPSFLVSCCFVVVFFHVYDVLYLVFISCQIKFLTSKKNQKAAAAAAPPALCDSAVKRVSFNPVPSTADQEVFLILV